MAVAHAVRVAVRVFVDPRTARNMATGPMPAHVLDVLKLAAREPDKLAEWSRELEMSPERLVDIAVFFIEQVMMPQEANHYRVMGVNPDATPSLLRAHYRWLMHVLHPDKPTAGWHFVMADRVNLAYAVLRDPARRAEYDRTLALGAPRHAAPFEDEDRAPARESDDTATFERPSEGAWDPEPTLPPGPTNPPEFERSFPPLRDSQSEPLRAPTPPPATPAPPRPAPAAAPAPEPGPAAAPAPDAAPLTPPPITFRLPPRPPEAPAEPRSWRIPLAVAAGLVLVIALVVILARRPSAPPEPVTASVPAQAPMPVAPKTAAPAPLPQPSSERPATTSTIENVPQPEPTPPPRRAESSPEPTPMPAAAPAVAATLATPTPTPTPTPTTTPAPAPAKVAPAVAVSRLEGRAPPAEDAPPSTAPPAAPPVVATVAPEALALARRVGAAYAAGDFLTVLNLVSDGGQLAPPDLAATAADVQRWGRERGGAALSVTGSSVLPALDEGRIERAAVMLTATDAAGLRVVMRRVGQEWKLERVITAAPSASESEPRP